MMCITCAVPVCNRCILSTHNGHVFESLEAKLKRSKDRLSKYIEKLDEKSELINDQLMMHSCTQHFIAGERQCSKEKIIEARDAITASVNAKSEKLIKQLETRMDKSKNEVSTIERKLNSALDKIEEAKKKA
ncbi:hypothetical protein FSP39_023419 [Pinctada imbricata]|uniref:B box-type domain-containing protein n=1 Tax=Pinctada imbricata TaxID=66713 RepID=A0AA89C8L6_PINIB|nr:hypothetical protein FSP39_023419 [Pinctada imbricata]